MHHTVTVRVTGYKEIEVDVDDTAEVTQRVNTVIEESDFGDLTNIEWEVSDIETEEDDTT